MRPSSRGGMDTLPRLTGRWRVPPEAWAGWLTFRLVLAAR